MISLELEIESSRAQAALKEVSQRISHLSAATKGVAQAMTALPEGFAAHLAHAGGALTHLMSQQGDASQAMSTQLQQALSLINLSGHGLAQLFDQVKDAVQATSDQAKISAGDLAQHALAMAQSIAGLASQMSQSILGSQKRQLKAYHQEELSQLKAREEAWQAHWQALEQESQATNHAMHDDLREQLSLGLLSEQEYREAVEALNAEEEAVEAERENRKKEEKEALEAEREALEAKQRQEKSAQEQKEFTAGKANAIVQATIAGALGIAKAWGSGNPITAGITTALIAATTAAQIGIISAQKYIPKYFSGTRSHGGGVALVGEAGAELVNLPQGSEVISAGKSKQLLGQGGGDTIHIHINAPIYGINDLEEAIGGILDKRERQASEHFGFSY